MKILKQFQRATLQGAIVALSLIFSILVFAPASAMGDDGEFWDAAVASLVYTKRLERSHFQFKGGMGALAKLDTPSDTPATWRILANGTFYGFKSDRYARLFSIYGSLGLGVGESDSTISLDAYCARISVYNYMRGGGFSLGIFSTEREKGVNEEYSAKLRSFEYAAGGEMKVFAVTLNTSALGYEFIRYYAKDGYGFTQEREVDGEIVESPVIYKYRDDYHGLLIFQLALKIGFVLGKDAPFSFEANFESDVEFSFPRQKDLGTAFEIVGHFNNRILPMDLSLLAGHRYSVNDHDGDDGPAFHDSYFFTSALLGVRY